MITTTKESLMSTLNCRTIECESREDWLQKRRSVLGASDIAAIFGEGYKNQSPLTVWHSKVHGQDANEVEEENERLLVGQDLEPGLRRILARKTGLLVEPPQGHVIHVHPEIDWLGCTLDSVVHDKEWGPIPGELKNVDWMFAKDWKDEDEGDGKVRSDGAPLKFMIQLNCQLAVTGAKGGYLMGLIGGNRPVVRRVTRNDSFINSMLKHLEKFWGYVERKEMPPVDDSIATAKVLAKMWPQDSGETIMLPPESLEWSEQLAEAKATIKEAKTKKVAFENKIKAAIGEATYGIIPGGGGFSWKAQGRAEHVVKASTFRVLRACK